MKGYDDEAVTNLAVDLYDYLSKDKLDESKDLVDQFYEDNYHTVIEEDEDLIIEDIDEETPLEKPKDKQVTFKEVLE